MLLQKWSCHLGRWVSQNFSARDSYHNSIAKDCNRNRNCVRQKSSVGPGRTRWIYLFLESHFRRFYMSQTYVCLNVSSLVFFYKSAKETLFIVSLESIENKFEYLIVPKIMDFFSWFYRLLTLVSQNVLRVERGLCAAPPNTLRLKSFWARWVKIGFLLERSFFYIPFLFLLFKTFLYILLGSGNDFILYTIFLCV